MLINKTSQRNKRGPKESGQAAVFLVLAMGLFLIGSMGFVVDGANLWFHRQSAQTAADAACTAGAMNMLSVAAGANPPSANWIGIPSFQCSGSTGSGKDGIPNSGLIPCQYAALNGYTSPGLQTNKGGNDVSVSFPGSFTSIPTCSDTLTVCTAEDIAATPYMQVNVTDRVQTTFIGMLNGGHTVDVGAQAMCGLSNVLSAIPVLVLNPNAPNGVSNALGGSGNLSVFGAPKSIQVNSTDINAVNLSGTISLSNTVSGDGNGEFAVAGRELESDAGVDPSVKWVNAAGVVSDPFASINVSTPAPAPIPDYGTTGCPGIPAGIPCDDYKPGYYPPIPCGLSLGGTAAICVGAGAGFPAGSSGLAVFEPGVYYLGEDFFAGPDSCLRSATSGGDGSGGTMFYLSFTGTQIATLNVSAGSGGLVVTNPTTGATFNCASTTAAVPVAQATCRGDDLGLGALGVQLTGNVLLAPCTGPYGDRTDKGNRGILFFHNRDKQPSDQPRWAGSGALVGNVYFHHCHLSPTGDSGANCDPDAFTETLTLAGGPNAIIVGGIVVDQLQINSGAINAVLNPNPQYHVLKASLLQ
jgi:hypothetical protein